MLEHTPPEHGKLGSDSSFIIFYDTVAMEGKVKLWNIDVENGDVSELLSI